MKTLFNLLLLMVCSIGGIGHSQSDWTMKPYIIVNDSLYEDVKHPVFIMDSTLYFRTNEGIVKTFPSRDVNYISKRCFYDRITAKEKNQLSRSIVTSTFISMVSFVFGNAAIQNNYMDFRYYLKNAKIPSYSPVEMFVGVGLVATSAVIIYRNIHRKKVTKMIIESKGLKFLS